MKTAYFIAFFLFAWGPAALAVPFNVDVYDLRRQRFNENSLRDFNPSAAIDTLFQQLDENGQWPDLNYEDRSCSSSLLPSRQLKGEQRNDHFG
jgi:hypothetical protein